MKRIKTIIRLNLIGLSAFFSLCSFGQKFNITNADISFDIKELIKPATKINLTHAVKYKNQFYCFFRVDDEDSSRLETKFCFVFSDTGKMIKKIEVPDKIEYTVYFDLFIVKDKIFVKTYMDSQTFYFDTTSSQWVKTNNAKDLIFEDEKYNVYSLDFGEWGGKTWFKDKKTNSEYLIEFKPPLINKIDNSYYLTNSHSVLKIENPANLNKCNKSVTYENITKDAKYAKWYGERIGFEIIYVDTTSKNRFYDLSYRPHIVSSFVFEKELFHIYETAGATYIAKCWGNSIEPVQKIGQTLRFYEWHYSYRNKIQKNGQQILKFEKDGNFGLLEINGKDIKIYNLMLK